MKRLLLVGAGHAHALVLQGLAAQPLQGVEVVVVSPQPMAPYSGMVPGWLSGAYAFDDIVVDFPALAQAANARWVQGELHTLDTRNHQATLHDGGVLDFDVLSLNVGSRVQPPATQHAQVLPLRPLSLLQNTYERVLQQWQNSPAGQPYTVTAVGGGAAGFESLLAVVHRLRRMRPDSRVQAQLVSRGAVLLPACAPAAQRAARHALQHAGVTLQLGSAWSPLLDNRSDLVLWATGAQPQSWQCDTHRRGALAVDGAGFIRIDPQLRSVSHPFIFACGDGAGWSGTGLAKAGVHAVRMAPVLLHNLRVAMGCSPVHNCMLYHPQQRMLSLLATGDGRAIASWGQWGTQGAWVWRWKDHIDRRFVRQFRSSKVGVKLQG